MLSGLQYSSRFSNARKRKVTLDLWISLQFLLSRMLFCNSQHIYWMFFNCEIPFYSNSAISEPKAHCAEVSRDIFWQGRGWLKNIQLQYWQICNTDEQSWWMYLLILERSHKRETFYLFERASEILMMHLYGFLMDFSLFSFQHSPWGMLSRNFGTALRSGV